jgi:butyryl-CoA dehydrogenase
MNFDLTDEQARIRAVAREVALSAVLPRAAETDRTGTWPSEIVAALAGAGLFGVNVPAAYGGQGADALSCALAIEEVSAACASSGLIMGAHSLLCCDPLCRFGTEPQKRSFLPALARGTKFCASALTQPLGEGDSCSATAQVDATGHGFVLDGSVPGFVGAEYADWILVLAAVSGGMPGRHVGGPTAFVVSTSSDGVRVGPPEPLVGARAAHIAAVRFEDCAVSATQVLGEVGGGRSVAQAARNSGRVAVASQAVGIARAAFEESVAFANDSAGLPTARRESQGLALWLADMATEIDAARMLVWRAARSIASGAKVSAECSMAKVYATEMSARVTHRAAHMRGYGGFLANASVERHGRDARLTEVFEGTSDVQRSVVASDLLTH